MEAVLLIPNGISLDPQKPKMLKQIGIRLLFDVQFVDILFISNESEEIFRPYSIRTKLQLKASEEGWYTKVQTVRTNGETLTYLKPINIQSLASVPHEDGTIDYYDAHAHHQRHFADPTIIKSIN